MESESERPAGTRILSKLGREQLLAPEPTLSVGLSRDKLSLLDQGDEGFDYSGYWTGNFEGTNQGGFTLDLKQNGSELTGVARLAEPAHGQYEYSVSGIAGENLSLVLKPGRQFDGINLGSVTVLASVDSHGQLAGPKSGQTAYFPQNDSRSQS